MSAPATPFSFKVSEFKEPEAPINVERLVDAKIRDTSPEYRAKYPSTAAQEFFTAWEGISYKTQDGQPFSHSMGLTQSKAGKLYPHLNSMAKALGIPEFEGPEHYAALATGKVFRTQLRPLPSTRRKNDDGPVNTYKHVIEEVQESEVANLIAARAPQTANGQQPQATPSISTEDAVLQLVGDGGTRDDLRKRLMADPVLKAMGALASGIIGGQLLDRMVAEGQLSKSGDTYSKA